MVQEVFTAIEVHGQVRKAVRDWHEKFAKGAERHDGLGGAVLWHQRLGMWGHFSEHDRNDGSHRYWNPFGFSPVRHRHNIIVEINPPAEGRDNILQGVLARTNDGSRWPLHKGRMSIPGAHISGTQFDAASSSGRKPVNYTDGKVIESHPVANIDADAITLQNEIASFVANCHHIRRYYSLGAEVAAQEATVEAAESGSPELTGSYLVGVQAAKVVLRQHGDVWHALTKKLDEFGVRHTNGRVGRWGPDLRTTGSRPVLFEIKVTTTASDIQRAVGQLLLYERLLPGRHKKVLVLPKALEGHLATAIRDLGMEVLPFARKSRSVSFETRNLKRLTE